jgi:heterodisulfide reductase subunit C
MIKVNSGLIDKIKIDEDFNASACFNCGTCSALCPVGFDILPRKLFRYVLLGDEEKILESTDQIFSCLLCRMCEEQCPHEVNITENIRFIRNYLAKSKLGV